MLFKRQRGREKVVAAGSIETNAAVRKLQDEGGVFSRKLDGIKREIDPTFPWYPYGTLTNLLHLGPFLTDHPIESLTSNRRIADVGAADGELAFFLESLGYNVDVVDHAPTNFNGMRGLALLKEHLGSKITVHDIDLDAQFSLPQSEYDLVFFLGILYHLKNPFYVLENLALRTKYLFVSTRVARFTSAGTPINTDSVAYLVDTLEMNNDATNFWIFSEAGLKRLFARTGWDVVAYRSVGDTERSNSQDNDHDERAFALLRRR